MKKTTTEKEFLGVKRTDLVGIKSYRHLREKVRELPSTDNLEIISHDYEPIIDGCPKQNPNTAHILQVILNPSIIEDTFIRQLKIKYFKIMNKLILKNGPLNKIYQKLRKLRRKHAR